MIGKAILVNNGIGRQIRELSEDDYYWMFTCVAPLRSLQHCFVNSEPVTTLKDGTTNLYSCCFHFNIDDEKRYFLATLTCNEFNKIATSSSHDQFLEYLSIIPPLRAVVYNWRMTYTSHDAYTQNPIDIDERLRHYISLMFNESGSSLNSNINMVERNIAIKAVDDAMEIIVKRHLYSDNMITVGKQCLEQSITPTKAVETILTLIKHALHTLDTEFQDTSLAVDGFLFTISFIHRYWTTDYIPRDVIELLTMDKLAARLFHNQEFVKINNTWLTYQYEN